MTSSNFVALMLTFFAFSMGQTFGLDSNLFGGRNQFLCFGENSDIVKLNDGEPQDGALAANLFRRYSFNVQGNLNRVKCSTIGTGDIDLYMCDEPEGEECIQNPDASSKTDASSTESVISPAPGKRTWYIIVKAQPEISSYTIQCDEAFSF